MIQSNYGISVSAVLPTFIPHVYQRPFLISNNFHNLIKHNALMSNHSHLYQPALKASIDISKGEWYRYERIEIKLSFARYSFLVTARYKNRSKMSESLSPQ